MPNFGKLPRRKFTPPKATRGGNTSFFQKKKETPLTGTVQGLKAAQGEERFARTLDKAINKGLVREHFFRWTTLRRGTVGYKELDELIITPNRVYAISIKGVDFVHRSAGSKEQDKLNEIIILSQLRSLGYDVREIISIPADKLNTQEDADKVAKSIGVYR